MAKRRKTQPSPESDSKGNAFPLVWVKARYGLHTFSYRDPRNAFSAATALPVPSPTAVLLGICSTLYQLDRDRDAEEFSKVIHHCRVKVEAPDGAIFFRAFHQLRRYARETTKKKGERPKPNIGFTEINQGTREYGLLQGPLDIYVGVPEGQRDAAVAALANRDHIGTHDSLCSLISDVEKDISEPLGVLYEPLIEANVSMSHPQPTTIITLSRFTSSEFGPASLPHWKMSGGQNVELTPFLIPGAFRGTRNGKIYQKR